MWVELFTVIENLPGSVVGCGTRTQQNCEYTRAADQDGVHAAHRAQERM